MTSLLPNLPPGFALAGTDGTVVDLGAGKSVRFIVRSEQTGGHFSVVEHPVAPGFLGAPWHTHHGEDQYSYVLYGRIGALIGEQQVTAETGTFLFKPRGIPHTFWNPGPDPAAVLEMVSPGGFEGYFEELGVLFAADGEFDLDAFSRLTARYRLELDLTSLRWLPERFGLRVDDPRA